MISQIQVLQKRMPLVSLNVDYMWIISVVTEIISKYMYTSKIVSSLACIKFSCFWWKTSPPSHLHVRNFRLPDRSLDAAFLKVRDGLHASELALVHELKVGRFSGGFGRFRLRGFDRLRGDATFPGGLGHCGRKRSLLLRSCDKYKKFSSEILLKRIGVLHFWQF